MQKVLIIDFGSQYTQLITRRIRELGVYAVVKSAGVPLKKIRELDPGLVIFSGGPNSVYDDGAPQISRDFYDYQKEKKFPVLGICYGMHLIMKDLGGQVRKASVREYGRMSVEPVSASGLFSSKKKFTAWMSHGDETNQLPKGFAVAAKSESGAIAAVENVDAHIYCLQFHPEVTHTEGGGALLKDLVFDKAKLPNNWSMSSVLSSEIEKIQAKVKEDEHVLCALSGGVDSTVAAAIVQKAIGDRLHCIFVDHGMLRYEERARVMKMFDDHLHLSVQCVDASDAFLTKLSGVVDPEEKRKTIGAEFITVFEKAAHDLEKQKNIQIRHLVQGTLYPDVIESQPPPGEAGAVGWSHKIKSHHNVGGLPEKMNLKLIEPLRELFKDEVRAIGRTMGIPAPFLQRHPFPGPGLAVRIIGEITSERIDILQRADEIFISTLKEKKLYDEIWQAFGVFLPLKTVGVQGDGRTHDHCIALRAVTSRDGMTADWYPIPHDVLALVSSRICNEVAGVNRVVYDISSKPPATIEWE